MKREETQIHTTTPATGANKNGYRVKFRQPREAAAARAFAAVHEAHSGNLLTLRKRTRSLGNTPS